MNTFYRWIVFVSLVFIGSVLITMITMPIGGFWLMVPVSLVYGAFGISKISVFCFGYDLVKGK